MNLNFIQWNISTSLNASRHEVLLRNIMQLFLVYQLDSFFTKKDMFILKKLILL